MTCVCIKREKIRTHICVHACIETDRSCNQRHPEGRWVLGTDVLLYVYVCI